MNLPHRRVHLPAWADARWAVRRLWAAAAAGESQNTCLIESPRPFRVRPPTMMISVYFDPQRPLLPSSALSWDSLRPNTLPRHPSNGPKLWVKLPPNGLPTLQPKPAHRSLHRAAARGRRASRPRCAGRQPGGWSRGRRRPTGSGCWTERGRTTRHRGSRRRWRLRGRGGKPGRWRGPRRRRRSGGGGTWRRGGRARLRRGGASPRNSKSWHQLTQNTSGGMLSLSPG